MRKIGVWYWESRSCVDMQLNLYILLWKNVLENIASIGFQNVSILRN